MKEFLAYLKSHAGRVWGAAIGLAAPLLWWRIGFAKTLLLALCVLVGYGIGRIIDDPEWFRDFLDKFLPRKED